MNQNPAPEPTGSLSPDAPQKRLPRPATPAKSYVHPDYPNKHATTLEDAFNCIDQLHLLCIRLDARTSALMKAFSRKNNAHEYEMYLCFVKAIEGQMVTRILREMTKADPLAGARLQIILNAQLAAEAEDEGSAGPN